MPFLYNPKDTDSDPGIYSASWSYQGPNISAFQNTPRHVLLSDLRYNPSQSTPRRSQVAPRTAAGASHAQNPSQTGATRVPIRRIMIDATGATPRRPRQVVPLSANPLGVGSAGRAETTAIEFATVISSRDEASLAEQIRQVTPILIERARAQLAERVAARDQAERAQAAAGGPEEDSEMDIDEGAGGDRGVDLEQSAGRQ